MTAGRVGQGVVGGLLRSATSPIRKRNYRIRKVSRLQARNNRRRKNEEYCCKRDGLLQFKVAFDGVEERRGN